MYIFNWIVFGAALGFVFNRIKELSGFKKFFKMNAEYLASDKYIEKICSEDLELDEVLELIEKDLKPN